MTRVKPLAIGVALLATSVIIGVLVTSTPVDAQNPFTGSAPVNIVSPLPLPVTGNIGGAVSIANGVSNPVAVRDVDAAAREPFQVGSDLRIFDEHTGSVALVTVPAGKRLVVEHVSAWVQSAVSGGLTSAGLSAGVIDFVECTRFADDMNGRSNFVCSAQTKFTVEPGRTLLFYAATAPGAGGALRAMVSGYYVPVP